MPDTNIEGIFFENQILTAKGLGAFGNGALSDGVLTGCEVSTNGLVLTIGTGYIVVGGRVAYLSQPHEFTLSSGSGNGTSNLIVATVDTTALSVEDTFSQVSLSLVSGTNVSGVFGNIPSSGNINMLGTSASTWLVYATTTHSSSIGTLYRNAATSNALFKIYTNSGTNFDAQTLTIPAIREFDAILVSSWVNNEDMHRTTHICSYDRTSSGTYIYPLTSTVLSGTSNSIVVRHRRLDIVPADGTLTFYTGYVSTTTTGNSGIMVPKDIYGIRGKAYADL